MEQVNQIAIVTEQERQEILKQCKQQIILSLDKKKNILDLSHLNLGKLLPQQLTELFVLITREIPTIQQLDISHNDLSFIPTEIGNLIHLQHLNLWHNNLNSLPNVLIKLGKLNSLNCEMNQFTQVPLVVCDLPLSNFSMRGNPLVTIPWEIGKLKQLTSLSFENCALKTLPIVLKDLSKLSYITVAGNPLEMVSVSLFDHKKINNSLKSLNSILYNTLLKPIASIQQLEEDYKNAWKEGSVKLDPAAYKDISPDVYDKYIAMLNQFYQEKPLYFFQDEIKTLARAMGPLRRVNKAWKNGNIHMNEKMSTVEIGHYIVRCLDKNGLPEWLREMVRQAVFEQKTPYTDVEKQRLFVEVKKIVDDLKKEKLSPKIKMPSFIKEIDFQGKHGDDEENAPRKRKRSTRGAEKSQHSVQLG